MCGPARRDPAQAARLPVSLAKLGNHFLEGVKQVSSSAGKLSRWVTRIEHGYAELVRSSSNPGFTQREGMRGRTKGYANGVQILIDTHRLAVTRKRLFGFRARLAQ